MNRTSAFARPSRRLRPLCIACALAAFALPGSAHADLVVFEDGRVLKVRDYAVEGDRVALALGAGGAMKVELARIERIVEDEVDWPAPPAPAEAAPAVATAAAFVWSFAEEHEVPATPYGEEIYAAARRHAVNPQLVAALVRAESAFDVYAVSPKGARGLMQLMPATARRFGLSEREIFVPERNLEAGTRYLRWLLDRFGGDVTRALAAYNAGEGTVDRYGGVPPFRETRGYIRRIAATLGVALSI